MAKPSVQASQAGRQLAEQSLKLAGLTKKSLSEAIDCSRQPVTNFFKGVAIEQGLFVRLCDRLNLDWQVVAGLTPLIEAAALVPTPHIASIPAVETIDLKIDHEGKDSRGEDKSDEDQGIDELVRSLRTAAKDSLYERCGTIRVLDMSHPVGLSALYTHVNILEQVSFNAGVHIF